MSSFFFFRITTVAPQNLDTKQYEKNRVSFYLEGCSAGPWSRFQSRRSPPLFPRYTSTHQWRQRKKIIVAKPGGLFRIPEANFFPSRIRILPSLSKNSNKNLDVYCFVTFLWFLSQKTDVNVPLKSHEASWRSLTKELDPEQDPYPYQNVTDPQQCSWHNSFKNRLLGITIYKAIAALLTKMKKKIKKIFFCVKSYRQSG